MKAAALCAGLALLAVAVPAHACSVGNPPARTLAKRIAGRDDLQRVTGTLRFVSMVQPGDERDSVHIHARVTDARGRAFDVTYLWDQLWIDCLVYFLPQAEASGKFYLSRDKRDGEHELVDWEGAYIAGGAEIRSTRDGGQQ